MTIAQRIGARMRQAAADAGLSNQEVGRLMGYTGTVTAARWYNGKSQPSYEDMALFGEIVERPFSWFFKVDEGSEDEAEFLVDVLVAVLYRMLADESVADALVGELGDPALVPPSVRRMLSDMEEAGREILADLTGGWSELPPAERRRRLRGIVNTYLDVDAL